MKKYKKQMKKWLQAFKLSPKIEITGKSECLKIKCEYIPEPFGGIPVILLQINSPDPKWGHETVIYSMRKKESEKVILQKIQHSHELRLPLGIEMLNKKLQIEITAVERRSSELYRENKLTRELRQKFGSIEAPTTGSNYGSNRQNYNSRGRDSAKFFNSSKMISKMKVRENGELEDAECVKLSDVRSRESERQLGQVISSQSNNTSLGENRRRSQDSFIIKIPPVELSNEFLDSLFDVYPDILTKKNIFHIHLTEESQMVTRKLFMSLDFLNGKSELVFKDKELNSYQLKWNLKRHVFFEEDLFSFVFLKMRVYLQEDGMGLRQFLNEKAFNRTNKRKFPENDENPHTNSNLEINSKKTKKMSGASINFPKFASFKLVFKDILQKEFFLLSIRMKEVELELREKAFQGISNLSNKTEKLKLSALAEKISDQFDENRELFKLKMEKVILNGKKNEIIEKELQARVEKYNCLENDESRLFRIEDRQHEYQKKLYTLNLKKQIFNARVKKKKQILQNISTLEKRKRQEEKRKLKEKFNSTGNGNDLLQSQKTVRGRDEQISEIKRHIQEKHDLTRKLDLLITKKEELKRLKKDFGGLEGIFIERKFSDSDGNCFMNQNEVDSMLGPSFKNQNTKTRKKDLLEMQKSDLFKDGFKFLKNNSEIKNEASFGDVNNIFHRKIQEFQNDKEFGVSQVPRFTQPMAPVVSSLDSMKTALGVFKQESRVDFEKYQKVKKMFEELKKQNDVKESKQIKILEKIKDKAKSAKLKIKQASFNKNKDSNALLLNLLSVKFDSKTELKKLQKKGSQKTEFLNWKNRKIMSQGFNIYSAKKSARQSEIRPSGQFTFPKGNADLKNFSAVKKRF